MNDENLSKMTEKQLFEFGTHCNVFQIQTKPSPLLVPCSYTLVIYTDKIKA